MVGEHEISPSEVLYKVREVGKFLITSGRRIICDPRSDADAGLLKAFISGPVMAILLHQRKMMPLHASCVALNGKAIAFVGGSGSGKSTTAVMLHKRGYDFVSDDILTLRFPAEDGNLPPTVCQTGRTAKLWDDASQLLNVANDMADKEHSGTAKRTFNALPARAAGASRSNEKPRLSAIFILRWIFPDSAGIEILSVPPFESIGLLRKNVYRQELVLALGLEGDYLGRLARIRQSVPVFTLARPFASKALPSIQDAVARYAGIVE